MEVCWAMRTSVTSAQAGQPHKAPITQDRMTATRTMFPASLSRLSSPVGPVSRDAREGTRGVDRGGVAEAEWRQRRSGVGLAGRKIKGKKRHVLAACRTEFSTGFL